MTRPLPVLGAGAVLVLILGGLVVAGVVLERWSLVALAGWALGSAVLLVQLDSWRRVRSLRRYVRDQVREALPAVTGTDVAAPAPSVVASPEDVVGAVRLLQAQYVGRLDRMQTALEETLTVVRDRDDASSQTG